MRCQTVASYSITKGIPMKKLLLLLFIVTVLSGCKTTVTSAVPQDYVGNVVNINDTYERQSSGSAIFYYTDNINNIEVNNALSNSSGGSYGQGNKLSLRGIARKMPLSPQRIKLVGRYFHIMPLVSIVGFKSEQTVEGWVTLELKADTDYVIKGNLSEAYSAIWIEDHHGQIVSEVIDRIGDNKQLAMDAKKQLFEQRPTANDQSRQALFAGISEGEPEALVNRKLGEPINAEPILERHNLSINRYKDVGSVQFNDRFFVTATMLVIGETVDELALLEQQLATEDGLSLRKTIRNYYDRDLTNQAALDLLAQKLWQQRGATERNMVDAIAWICRVINKSKNGRYHELLTTLALNPQSSKLRKWARKSRIGLVRGLVVQFVPNE
jgi:hypothetical protein